MELEREILKTFTTVAAPDEVLNLLANVPESARHMPDVETVVANDDGHCWTMRKLGAGKISHQATYTSRFVADASAGTVTWGARRDLGNSWAHGQWRVEARDGGSVVHLRSSFGVRLPVPALLKKMALAVFEREYGRLMDAYCTHLKSTLDGGDGRLR